MNFGKALFGGASKRTIYRAVDAAELASISNNKQFLLKQGGTEFKYFARNLKDAHEFGNLLYPQGYSVVRGTVSKSVDMGKYWWPTVDNMDAYIFPGDILPYIKPTIP